VARYIASHGVSDSRLPDIAAYLGLTRSALYYYARSKEDLVYQVYRRSGRRLAAAFGGAAGSTGSVLDRVVGFASAVILRPQLDILPIAEVGMLDSEQQTDVLSAYESTVASLAALLRDGIARREVRPCDSDVVARTIISSLHHIASIKLTLAAAPLAPGMPEPAADGPLDGVDAHEERLAAGAADLLRWGWVADRTREIPVRLEDALAFAPQPVRAFDRDSLAKAKREAIIVAASRLFNRRGVSSTTLDDIAAELGATKRTLYHHVGDKQALMSACAARARDIAHNVHAAFERRVGAGEDPLEAIVNFQRVSAFVAASPAIEPFRTALRVFELSDADQAENARFIDWLVESWRRRNACLDRDRDVRPHDSDALALLTVGAANWLAKGLVAIPPENAAHVATEVVEVLRIGLEPVG
jgi:AcrR family transcriptional regulator